MLAITNRMVLPTGKNISTTTTAVHIRNYMAKVPTSRPHITCFRCGEQGHYKSECFQWKTRACWHFTHAHCRDPYCSFAHGAAEMRAPWLQKCIRVTKKDGVLVCLGCKQYGHVYMHCPERNLRAKPQERIESNFTHSYVHHRTAL